MGRVLNEAHTLDADVGQPVDEITKGEDEETRQVERFDAVDVVVAVHRVADDLVRTHTLAVDAHCRREWC